jgi:hypothetical protein
VKNVALFVLVLAAVFLGTLGAHWADRKINSSLTPQCSDEMSLKTLEKILFEQLQKRAQEDGLSLAYNVLDESIITKRQYQTLPRHSVNECMARYEIVFDAIDENGQNILNNRSNGKSLYLTFDAKYSISLSDKDSNQFWVYAEHVPTSLELYGRW